MSKEKYKQYAGLTVRPLIYPLPCLLTIEECGNRIKLTMNRQKQLLSQEKKVKNETNN
jgi:hypothetical protein